MAQTIDWNQVVESLTRGIVALSNAQGARVHELAACVQALPIAEGRTAASASPIPGQLDFAEGLAVVDLLIADPPTYAELVEADAKADLDASRERRVQTYAASESVSPAWLPENEPF